MTDLKQLLDEAAGPEPAVTDADLTNDLTRGRRAQRRRRVTGIAGGAVATAAAISVGWSLLPAALQNTAPSTTSGPGQASANPTAYATPSASTARYKHPVPPSAKDDPRPIPPVFATEVPLATNTTPFPGEVTCDLVPKGWAVRINKDGLAELYDPKLQNPEKYRALSYTVVLRPTELKRTGKGLMTDQTDVPWGGEGMGTTRAGNNEAVVFGIQDSAGQMHPWQKEVYVRQGSGLKVVDVADYAWPLAWELPTLLKFAGSCHYK